MTSFKLGYILILDNIRVFELFENGDFSHSGRRDSFVFVFKAYLFLSIYFISLDVFDFIYYSVSPFINFLPSPIFLSSISLTALLKKEYKLLNSLSWTLLSSRKILANCKINGLYNCSFKIFIIFCKLDKPFSSVSIVLSISIFDTKIKLSFIIWPTWFNQSTNDSSKLLCSFSLSEGFLKVTKK